MEKPISIELEGPIVVVTYHGAASDAQYSEHLDELTAAVGQVVEGEGRIAMVLDATAWLKSSAVQRQMQAQWLKKNLRVLARHGGHTALALSSGVVRAGLTGVLWLVRLPDRYTVCATREDALQWARARLQPVPSAAPG